MVAGHVSRAPWKASALLAGVLLLLGLIGFHGGLPNGIKYILEIILLVPMVLMIALHPGVRGVFQRMPRAQRNFTLVFFAAFWLGNIVKEHQVLFPLTSWGMFGRSVKGLPAQNRYYGVYADGSEVPLMRGAELSDDFVSTLDGALWRTAEPYFKAKYAAVQDATVQNAAVPNATRDKLVAGLTSLARIHEADQSAASGTLRGVRMERCEIAVTGDYQPTCRLVIDTSRAP